MKIDHIRSVSLHVEKGFIKIFFTSDCGRGGQIRVEGDDFKTFWKERCSAYTLGTSIAIQVMLLAKKQVELRNYKLFKSKYPTGQERRKADDWTNQKSRAEELAAADQPTTKEYKPCWCGADACGSPRHADYCPKYKSGT